jgi:hypothetical protein
VRACESIYLNGKEKKKRNKVLGQNNGVTDKNLKVLKKKKKS